MESGFTAERGFDATPVTRRGLQGRKYPRDFLRSIKKEGFGRIKVPVSGRNYIRYDGGSYHFAVRPSGGKTNLVPRFSAAARRSQRGLNSGTLIEADSPTLKQVFGSSRWEIVDTGGGLRRWQVDCYYGDDEPMGPGHFMARPRSTTFEYSYSFARVIKD